LKEKKVSKRSDIYSYGMTCIEVFTRQPPFPNLAAMEVAMGVATGKIRPQIPNECPPSFKETLGKCIAFEESNRPFAHDILTFLKHH
jgi:serine/threonine protein kinase